MAPASFGLTSTTSVPDRSWTLSSVGSGQGVQIDDLDVVGVHDDGAEAAGEAQARAVGRGIEDLVAAAAVEQHRVAIRLSLDRVAAVARIPLEDIVAGAHEDHVVALLAVDEVAVVAAEQAIGSVAAQQVVRAGTAVDGYLDQR